MFAEKPDGVSGGSGGFQTDVRRKAALATAEHSSADAGGSGGVGDDDGEAAVDNAVTSAEYLAEIEEDVNRAIDREVETLVEGMKEIVGLAAVKGPDKTRAMQESLAVSLRAETLARAVAALLGLGRALKMMWLLGDDACSAAAREEAREKVLDEIDLLKAEVKVELERSAASRRDE